MSKPKDNRQGMENQELNQDQQNPGAGAQEQQEDQLVGPQGDQITSQHQEDRQQNQEQRNRKQRH